MAADARQPEQADVDLIVATLGRDGELTVFLDSVRAQAPIRARVIVVDQNEDDRVGALLRRQVDPLDVVRVRADGGVSHARNSGQALATAPIVAWPDDDCIYPSGLLSYVMAEFLADPRLDVLVGRVEDPSGHAGPFGAPTKRLVLDYRSVWRYPSAPTFFARRRAAGQVGGWSTSFGPRGTSQWDAGEDTDWLIRAVQSGLCVRFDPAVKIVHRDPFLRRSPEARRRARRYGRCTSALALAHGYGARFVVWLVIRATGGVVVSLATGRFARAEIHFQAAVGRIEGAARFMRERRRAGEAGPHADTSRRTRPSQ